ncbi:MAG: hypothetical protein MJZ77_09005 [Bacteroidales bacterium]|nr:hypothetical protein [Bacteroidales bacterium]
MRKIVFFALSLFVFGNVFANENATVKSLVSNDAAYAVGTATGLDTTVTIERMLSYEELSAYVNSMDEKGWYLKCMLVDDLNKIIKITFTDVAPAEKKCSDKCRFYGIVVTRQKLESHDIIEIYKDGQLLPEGYFDGDKFLQG